jgi:DNA polymerase/3'-5' exonuclease PolX
LSTGTPLPFNEAREIAERVAKVLAPHVVRLKAVGSLRRKKAHVGDIEFLAEARMVPVDLLGTMGPDVGPLRMAMLSLGKWVKGGDRMLQVTDVDGRRGLKLEVYLIHPPAEWGSQLAIRTGPADLGHLCMILLKERGYGHEDGHAFELASGKAVPTPDEEEFFRLAGVPFVPPARRDALVHRLEAERNG